jgi:hypothetical protein
MVVFFVFWQAARNPPKKIKFQQSHAHTCVQGIIHGACPDHNTLISQHALGLAGLRESIRRRRRPPPPAAAVRPFYSNLDWLDYGLILLVN